jgi:hypothetical protein
MSDMVMKPWWKKCEKCGAWFHCDVLTKEVMYEQTYQGVTVKHHGWVTERVICPECQAPRRKRAEMDI